MLNMGANIKDCEVVHLDEAKKIDRLSGYTTNIGLIYIVIELLSGFSLVYSLMRTGSAPSMMISAHSHFLCMSIIILIVGLSMKHWARDLEDEKYILIGAQLISAKISVVLLALENIRAFISYSAQMPQPGLIGDILYFAVFLIVAIGWIMSFSNELNSSFFKIR